MREILARLQAIMAERAAWTDHVAQISHLHIWLLEVEHILDGSQTAAGEAVSNATVGYRLDCWREQMARHLLDGSLSELERECLTEFFHALANLRPYLVQCDDREEFPRTKNERERSIRRRKARATAASAAVRIGTPISCATGARWPTSSGGSRMLSDGSTSSSELPRLIGPAFEHSVKKSPAFSTSNSLVFASVTGVRLFSRLSRHAGLLLRRDFCPDGFF